MSTHPTMPKLMLNMKSILVTKYGVDAKQLDLATSLEQEPILKDSVKAVR
jgi:hypothetical protein